MLDRKSAPIKLCGKLGIERIVAGIDIVDGPERGALGAVVAQKPRKRMHILGRAVQRQHAGRSRTAERRSDAELLARLGKERIVHADKARAYLAIGLGAHLRGNAVEEPARGLAPRFVPEG